MNKEVKEICMKCELEFYKRGKGCAFRSLGNEYCDLIEDFNKSITNYQNQVEKLTQENNDLEERVIHQDNLIKQLEVWIKEQIEFVRDIPTFTKEIKLSHTQQIATYQYVLDKLNEIRGKMSDKEIIRCAFLSDFVRESSEEEIITKLIELDDKQKEKDKKIKQLESVIDKAIDIVEKEISNYGSDKYLDSLLEILRSKEC